MLWSAPPRERPMFTIIRDTVGTNDIQYPRCTGFLYEYQYGFETHTNCHDILAESIREYGLTPDDVHDSFNFWMHTGVDDQGRLYIKRMLAKPGDYVELIAHFDVLAVPNVCGADIFSTSNFELKPLKLQVLEPARRSASAGCSRRSASTATSARPPTSSSARSRSRASSSATSAYSPRVGRLPDRQAAGRGAAGGGRVRADRGLRANGGFGEADADIVRHAFFSWWIEEYMQGPKHQHAGSRSRRAGGTLGSPSAAATRRDQQDDGRDHERPPAIWLGDDRVAQHEVGEDDGGDRLDRREPGRAARADPANGEVEEQRRHDRADHDRRSSGVPGRVAGRPS